MSILEAPKLSDILEGLSRARDPSTDWMELVRDLNAPIPLHLPELDLQLRWAEKKDLLMIDALQGFVEEIEYMEKCLAQGDRCLLLERAATICAFAWVTFRDYRLSLWHTVHLPPGCAYLVFIDVRIDCRRKGVGTCLLESLMRALREGGYSKLIAGMYGGWEHSIRFHQKSGFRICRRYTERRILRFLPCPPKIIQFDEQ